MVVVGLPWAGILDTLQALVWGLPHCLPVFIHCLCVHRHTWEFWLTQEVPTWGLGFLLVAGVWWCEEVLGQQKDPQTPSSFVPSIRLCRVLDTPSSSQVACL